MHGSGPYIWDRCRDTSDLSPRPAAAERRTLGARSANRERDRRHSFKVKVKVCTLDTAPLRETPPQKRSGTCSQGISQFYLHTHSFNPQSE